MKLNYLSRTEPQFRNHVMKDKVEYRIGIPWHVIIYSNADNEEYFNAVCDGTILNAKLVMSVAHCFWDKTEKKFYDPSNFNMVPAKFFQYSYEVGPQSLNVAQINYYKDFNGQGKYYALDVVLLVLEEHFIFDVSIAPICIETVLSGNDVKSGLSGELAGWRISASEGLRIHALQFIEASVIEFNECVSKFSNDLRRPNIARDKFCVAYTKRPALNPSHGGSFELPNKVDNRTVYSLRGVFSFSRADKNSNKMHVVLTNVQDHVDMIRVHLNKTIDEAITCADQSNKDPRLCAHSVSNTGTITATQTPIIGGSCLVPDVLPDTVTVYYDAEQDQEIMKGSYAVPFAQILYRCKTNYTLVGSSSNFCLDGIWSENHPTCLKFCSPKPIHGVTIRATCEINGEQIECLQSHKPGTIVHIACALGYRKPTDRVFTDVLYCDETGEWDFPAFRCEQICGVEGRIRAQRNT